MEIWKVKDTDITNEVQWVIRLLHSTKEQSALHNAGANALFCVPFFAIPGAKIIFLGLLRYNSLTAFNL